MSDKNVDLTILPSLLPSIDLVEVIDKALQIQIDLDRTGTMQRVFNYYDSVAKPLDNREFIQFWESLSESEKTAHYERFFL
jgi:hypothetical protein